MTKFRVRVLDLIAKANLVNQLYEFLEVTVSYAIDKKGEFVSMRIEERGESIYFDCQSEFSSNQLQDLLNTLDEILLNAKEVI